jgi:hypothetical protein
MTRRRKRARRHIAQRELLAAALSLLLPQEQRDRLRAVQVPARQIIRLFTPDHNILHALGGPDRWWNLTMTLRGPALKAKDGRDTSIVAKSDRLAEQHEDFRRRVLAPEKRRRRKGEKYWGAKRRLQREWPKRKLQSRNSFERRPA